MALRACPSCSRHVRLTDATCPFCSAEQPAAPAAKPAVRSALGTRAAMLFGATAIAIEAACSSESTVAMYGAPAPEPTVDAGEDGGSPVAMYGAPAPDASLLDASVDAPTDAASDADSAVVAAYGAPGPDQ